jgi:broad specificity phosphatase PhoE
MDNFGERYPEMSYAQMNEARANAIRNLSTERNSNKSRSPYGPDESRNGNFNLIRNVRPDPNLQPDPNGQPAPINEIESYVKYAVIVSHNARIRCLLGKMGFNPEFRFQNCCVLKLEINFTPGELRLSLLHSGYLSEKDKASANKIYYVSPSDTGFEGGGIFDWFTKKKTVNPPIQPDIGQPGQDQPDIGQYVSDTVPSEPLGPDLNQHGDLGLDQPGQSKKNRLFKPYISNIERLGIKTTEKIVFYIVRHGKSQHNEGFNTHLISDTHVIRKTDADRNSIIKAAEQIQIDLRDNPMTMFVSDLLRTRETAYEILKKMYREKRIPLVVLPCSHEVASVGNNGDCDIGSFVKKGAFENYPKCTTDMIVPHNIYHNFSECEANWDLYKLFYDGRVRNDQSMFNKSRRLKCRDTNMIALAIYFLSNQDLQYDTTPNANIVNEFKRNYLKNYLTGGTRKKRKRKTKKNENN